MRQIKLLLLAALCLTLTACGQGSGGTPPEVSAPEPAVSSTPAASQPEEDGPEADSSEPEEDPGLLPLTQEELAAAHQAAHDYYKNTVFEDIVLTEIAPREGEISFRVSCTKGGVKVDPDRFISLERQDGVWAVTAEGY